jgi:hypothetical protein
MKYTLLYYVYFSIEKVRQSAIFTRKPPKAYISSVVSTVEQVSSPIVIVQCKWGDFISVVLRLSILRHFPNQIFLSEKVNKRKN